jgi:LacI family transcriptional regulator
LQRNPRPDGVFCHNDPLAIGAMNTIIDAGLNIPDGIAIIDCGNLHYDDCLRVKLSSIDQHSEQIGQYAAEIVLGLIETKDVPAARAPSLKAICGVYASSRHPAFHLKIAICG